MNKAGLVTCYIDNYGACLQAYAMQTLLKKYNYDSQIIRYDYKVNINETKKSLISICAFTFKSIINILLRRKKYINFSKEYDHIIRHNNFASFRTNMLSFTSKIYKFDELSILDNVFDVYVCGSDQIWNPTLDGARDIRFDTLGFTSKYKIAYAPSIGIDCIPDKYIPIMKDNISKINCVSCREILGTSLLSKQLNISNCINVLDPTLMITKDHWIKLSKNNKKRKKYIFCYLFNWSDLYEKAIAYFKKVIGNIEVISISFSEKDYLFKETKNYSPRVEDFPSLIANAELVLTDSFHGTAFCINMNTNFYVFSRFKESDPLSMNSRIHSVLSIFNLEDRLIQTPEQLLKTNPSQTIDFHDVNIRLNSERQKSSLYLGASFSCFEKANV